MVLVVGVGVGGWVSGVVLGMEVLGVFDDWGGHLGGRCYCYAYVSTGVCTGMCSKRYFRHVQVFVG